MLNKSINKCQFCNENIQEMAQVCKHCGREQLKQSQIKEFAGIIAGRYWVQILIVSILLAAINSWLFILGLVAGGIAIYFYKRNIVEKWSVIDIYNKSREIKKRRRRILTTFFIVIGALLVLLIATNPNEAKLKAKIKAHDNVNMVNIVESHSIIVMSFYNVEIIDLSGQREEAYIGVLGSFYKVE